MFNGLLSFMSFLACDPRKDSETRMRVQVFTFEMTSGNVGRKKSKRNKEAKQPGQ